MTAETALRLGRRFGTSPEFWLGLQAAHDPELAREAHRWAAQAPDGLSQARG